METRTGLQDVFLNEARRGRVPLTVFLTNGFQQRGTIIAYDGLCVLACALGTDYNPSQGYSEMMLSSPGFVDCYRDFFLQRLINTNHR